MLNVAVLCSRRAPGLHTLLREHRPACVITTEESIALDARDVPVFAHPIRAFCKSMGASLRDDDARRLYDSETARMLQRLGVDTVLLLGYTFRVTAPLLDAFPNRILNIHDSDLPKYPGLHATRDAVAAGERDTRSSVHLVTPEIDRGPVLLRSKPFEIAPFAYAASIAGEDDIVRAYAYSLREWMMRSAWGDLAVRALDLVREGVAA